MYTHTHKHTHTTHAHTHTHTHTHAHTHTHTHTHTHFSTEGLHAGFTQLLSLPIWGVRFLVIHSCNFPLAPLHSTNVKDHYEGYMLVCCWVMHLKRAMLLNNVRRITVKCSIKQHNYSVQGNEWSTAGEFDKTEQLQQNVLTLFDKTEQLQRNVLTLHIRCFSFSLCVSTFLWSCSIACKVSLNNVHCIVQGFHCKVYWMVQGFHYKVLTGLLDTVMVVLQL